MVRLVDHNLLRRGGSLLADASLRTRHCLLFYNAKWFWDFFSHSMRLCFRFSDRFDFSS